MDDAARMAELLRFASYAKVGAALGVSRQAVQKWARGINVGPRQVEQVEGLFGLTAQTEAAPSITRRLLEGVLALEARVGVSAEDRAAAQQQARELEAMAEAMDRAIADDLERRPPRPAGRTTGRAGGRSGASLGSRRSAP